MVRRQSFQELVRLEHHDVQAPPRRFMADSLGNVGFADSRRAGEDQIAVLFDEPAGRDVADRLGGQHGIVEFEVEGFEGHAIGDAGKLEPLLEGVGFTAGQFILHQELGEFEVAELVLLRLACAQVQVVRHGGKPEMLQIVRKIVVQHGSPPETQTMGASTGPRMKSGTRVIGGVPRHGLAKAGDGERQEIPGSRRGEQGLQPARDVDVLRGGLVDDPCKVRMACFACKDGQTSLRTANAEVSLVRQHGPDVATGRRRQGVRLRGKERTEGPGRKRLRPCGKVLRQEVPSLGQHRVLTDDPVFVVDRHQ